MDVIEAWWRKFLIAVFGPCFLVAAAISFHAEERTAPLLAGLASGLGNVSNAARDVAQPIFLLPALFQGESTRV
ncbi:MAG TPA: hypothetical protein VG841_03740 [Caulobacterales bacterium]|nr:hypothetical protein [Caulobacterales bacterium]